MRGTESKFTLHCKLICGLWTGCVTFTQWIDAALQMEGRTGLSVTNNNKTSSEVSGQHIWSTSPDCLSSTRMVYHWKRCQASGFPELSSDQGRHF